MSTTTEKLREYRNPILIGVGALVVAILIYALFISHQNSKLSSLQTQETQLQGQQTQLQSQLTALESEKQKLPTKCADLTKISTQIPSVQNAGDLAAEQSSFYNQLTALVGSSGTVIPTFSWGTAGTTGSSTAGSTPTPAASGVVPVPVTMTITGDFGQMSAFVSGLDSFPRLFVIQTFNLSYGQGSASSAPTASSASSSSASAAAGPNAPPLWVGGVPTAPTAGPYTLSISGSIYYTTVANALAACTKATTAK